MVLSPWAVRELRFDESLGKLHGYDFDICMQARAAGKKVVTADFRAIHHHSLELINDPETWTQTYIRLAEKWNGQLPDTGRTPSSGRCAPRPRRPARGRSWSPTRCASQAIRRQLDRVQRRARQHQGRARGDEAGARGGEAGASLRGAQSPTRQSEPAPPSSRLRLLRQGPARSTTRSTSSGSSRSRAWRSARRYGQYAFYAIDKPSVRARSAPRCPRRRAGDHLLSAIEQAAERPGMEVLDGQLLGSGHGGRDRAGRRDPAVRRPPRAWSSPTGIRCSSCTRRRRHRS